MTASAPPPPSAPAPLASFKLNFAESRVRVVPRVGLDGRPFAGPGVDLVGDAARDELALAEPALAWLRAREPGITVRTLSIDLDRGRVLLTYAMAAASARPHVLRIDAPASSELIDLLEPLMARLSLATRAAIARRAAAPQSS